MKKTKGHWFLLEETPSILMIEGPPKIGDIITFKYKEFTKYNKPRFPIFLRVREKQ